jgi:hypothetical protein
LQTPEAFFVAWVSAVSKFLRPAYPEGFDVTNAPAPESKKFLRRFLQKAASF